LHAGCFGVQNAIRLDGLGLRIREQRVLDLVAVRKIFQNFLGIIADGRQLDALLFKS